MKTLAKNEKDKQNMNLKHLNTITYWKTKIYMYIYIYIYIYDSCYSQNFYSFFLMKKKERKKIITSVLPVSLIINGCVGGIKVALRTPTEFNLSVLILARKIVPLRLITSSLIVVKSILSTPPRRITSMLSIPK